MFIERSKQNFDQEEIEVDTDSERQVISIDLSDIGIKEDGKTKPTKKNKNDKNYKDLIQKNSVLIISEN